MPSVARRRPHRSREQRQPWPYTPQDPRPAYEILPFHDAVWRLKSSFDPPLTVDRLMELTGYSRGTVSALLVGRYDKIKLAPHHVEAFADALGVQPSFFVEWRMWEAERLARDAAARHGVDVVREALAAITPAGAAPGGPLPRPSFDPPAPATREPKRRGRRRA